MSCPNKNNPAWKLLVMKLGADNAMRIFKENNDNIPPTEIINQLSIMYNNTQTKVSISNQKIPQVLLDEINTKYNLADSKGRLRKFNNVEAMLDNLNRLPGFTFIEVNNNDGTSSIQAFQQVVSNTDNDAEFAAISSEKQKDKLKTRYITLRNIEELVLPEDIKLGVLKLIEQRDLIRSTMNRDKSKTAAIQLEIDDINHVITEIIISKKSLELVDIMEHRINSATARLKTSGNLTPTGLRILYSEILVWTDLINKWQDPANSHLEAHNNPIVQQRIAGLYGSLSIIQADFLHLQQQLYKNEMNKLLPRELKDEDLTRSREITKARRMTTDLSEVRDRLVQSIDKLLKGADRSSMNDYNKQAKTLENKLAYFRKNGLQLDSKEFRDVLLQKDKDGELTGELVDERSALFEDMEKKNIADKISLRYMESIKGMFRKVKSIKSWESSVYITVDLAMLQNNKKVELNRLVDLVGEVRAKTLIVDAELKYEEYKAALAHMKIILEERIKYDNDYNEADATIEKFIGEQSEKNALIDEKVSNAIRKWEDRNNPLNYTKYITDTTPTTYAMETNYVAKTLNRSAYNGKVFNEQFKVIEDNDLMYEFYIWYVEQLQIQKAKLPQDVLDNMSYTFLPEVYKEMTEKLSSGKNGLASVPGRIFEMLKSGEIADSFLQSIAVDNKVDNDNLYDSAGNKKRAILVKYTNNSIEIHKKTLDNLVVNKSVLEAKQASALKIIANNPSGTKTYIDAYTYLKKSKKELVKIEKQVEITTKKLATIRRDRSTDLVGVLKAFTLMATYHQHKAIVEDHVLAGRRILENIAMVETKDGSFVNKSEGAVQLKAATDYAINAVLYEEQRIDRQPSDNAIYINKDTRQQKKKIDNEMKALDKEFANGDITTEEYNIAIKHKEQELGELTGKAVSWSKVFDKFLTYTQLKGLGYNVQSAAINLIYGLISNQMYAASSEDIDNKSLVEAFKIMKGSMIQKTSGIAVGEARKVEALIDKFNVLFEVSEAAYGTKNTLSDKIKKLGILLPYEGQKRGEYIIQGMLLVAMLKSKTIQINGKNIALYEVFKENGEWDTEKYGEEQEEWSTDVTGLSNNSYTKFRDRIIQTIKRVHGNYDPTSMVEGKATSIGRMLFQFKSWIPAGITTRFERKRYDQYLDRDVKGRYRSIKDIGYGTGLKIMANPSYILGLKKIQLDSLGRLATAEDLTNMKYNLQEMRWVLLSVITSLTLAMLGAFASNDDEEEKLITLLINNATRLQGDMTFYLNPMTPIDLVKSPVAVLKSFTDIVKLVDASTKIIYKDDPYYNTEYYLRKVAKIIPFFSNVDQLYGATQRTYDKHPIIDALIKK